MNSSIKPPERIMKKYRFETDFDQEDERLRVDLLRDEEEKHEQHIQEETYVPLAPSFSEEELSYARDEAFKDGVAKGIEEARQGIENTLSGLVKQLLGQLEQLAQQEAAHVHDMQVLALQTVMAMIKKVWPTVVQRVGLDIVEETVRQSLEANPEESRIVIRVHDTLLDPMIRLLPEIEAKKAFAGKVIVMADQDVMIGDCKVEWADGGMERLSRDLLTRIEGAMEHIIALIPKTDSNVDTERTSL